MSVQPTRFPSAVVDLDSSDEEDGGASAVTRSNNTVNNQSHGANLATKPPAVTPSSNANFQPLENRSFWRAGGYEVGRTKSIQIEGDLEHARVHPKFLHSNATSHKWAFGAIAELLDNAVDEIPKGATFVLVDRIYNAKDNSPALLFRDDGGGMDPEGMRKCMSLGYSSKTSNTTIGQYGNGFKTSTMRLGADVIVFSRATRAGRSTQSVGLLSYTFLRRTRQDDVIVPMVDFDTSDHWPEPLVYGSLDDWSNNLKTILEWSPFASKEDLMLEFGDIGSHGTKIIIYNLWMNDEGIYELNFDDDDEDIRLRDEASQGSAPKARKSAVDLKSHLSYRMRFSLREYASILYLRKFTNFRIILRGKPVEQYSIADDLKHSKPISYRPFTGVPSKEVVVNTTIGFIKEAPALSICGFNIYHKNRLIRPYWKVTADGSSKGHGVVGVLEANFIEPAHDKQDFERSALFLKLETRLKQMVMEYWRGHCHLVGHLPDGVRKSDMPQKLPTQPQVQVGHVHNQSVVGGRTNPVQLIPGDVNNQSIVGGRTNPVQLIPGNVHNQSIVGGRTNPVQLVPGNVHNQSIVGGRTNPVQLVPGGVHNQSTVGGRMNPVQLIPGDVHNQSIVGGRTSPVQLIPSPAARPQFQLPRTVSSDVQLSSGPNSVSVPEVSQDNRTLNEICDENIRLYMRCEEYKEKEVELKRKVEELEKELQETRNKCAKISTHLETQRKEASSAQGW